MKALNSKWLLISSVLGVALLIILGKSLFSQNSTSNSVNDSEIIAYYDPNCKCCLGYFNLLESKGYKLKKVPLSIHELNAKKDELGIPLDSRSCHTMVIDGKFIEGHVPSEAIDKLISGNYRGVFSPHRMLSSFGKEEKEYIFFD